MGESTVQQVILVVDDEERNRALLRIYLRAHYDILEAESGPEALDALEGNAIDLVILDVMMPGMSGFDVCREMKRRVHDAFLPVLLLTALSEQEHRNAGLEAGADDFLSKPIDRHELALRVSAFLRIRQQDRTIRRQLDELRDLDALKDDLVSLMVHDLRNPLAGLIALLKGLRKELQGDELREDAEYALAAAAKVGEILDDMLKIRLLEEGKLRLALARQPLQAIVADARDSLGAAARERGVTLQIASSGDTTLEVDGKLLRRAIENLLANGIKYSQAGGAVNVEIHGKWDGIEMDVADRGPGVPTGYRERLFEKFGSVEAQGRMHAGHGLGLYLVKMVAAAHGGRVALQDREGGGSIFSLWLPRTRAAEDDASVGSPV